MIPRPSKSGEVKLRFHPIEEVLIVVVVAIVIAIVVIAIAEPSCMDGGTPKTNVPPGGFSTPLLEKKPPP